MIWVKILDLIKVCAAFEIKRPALLFSFFLKRESYWLSANFVSYPTHCQQSYSANRIIKRFQNSIWFSFFLHDKSFLVCESYFLFGKIKSKLPTAYFSSSLSRKNRFVKSLWYVKVSFYSKVFYVKIGFTIMSYFLSNMMCFDKNIQDFLLNKQILPLDRRQFEYFFRSGIEILSKRIKD